MSDLDTFQTASGYHFSGVGFDNLQEAKYTLAFVVADISSSVAGYKTKIEQALSEVVKACKRDIHVNNNLLLSVSTFREYVKELHGFRMVKSINDDEYTGSLYCSGMTALNDAVVSGVESCTNYAQGLSNNFILCNAVIFVITDGEENSSKARQKNVKKKIGEVMRNEELESINLILIGLTSDGNLTSYLQAYKDDLGINQYVDISLADDKSLAKLGGFISKSISSTSQALGTGGPSKALTF